MKITKLTIILLAICGLTQILLAEGTRGGGNTINGKLVESYIVDDPQNIPGFVSVVQPILSELDKKLPVFSAYLRQRIKLITWYLIPATLDQLPEDLTGLPLSSDQMAMQSDDQIFINSLLFLSPVMSEQERGKLLIHEIVLNASINIPRYPLSWIAEGPNYENIADQYKQKDMGSIRKMTNYISDHFTDSAQNLVNNLIQYFPNNKWVESTIITFDEMKTVALDPNREIPLYPGTSVQLDALNWQCQGGGPVVDKSGVANGWQIVNKTVDDLGSLLPIQQHIAKIISDSLEKRLKYYFLKTGIQPHGSATISLESIRDRGLGSSYNLKINASLESGGALSGGLSIWVTEFPHIEYDSARNMTKGSCERVYMGDTGFGHNTDTALTWIPVSEFIDPSNFSPYMQSNCNIRDFLANKCK